MTSAGLNLKIAISLVSCLNFKIQTNLLIVKMVCSVVVVVVVDEVVVVFVDFVVIGLE